MPLPEHAAQALRRLDHAALEIEHARSRPASVENLHGWLSNLTDYVLALSEIHEFDREQIQSRLTGAR